VTDALIKSSKPSWLHALRDALGGGIPLPLGMILLALALAMAGGIGAPAVVKTFSLGFGRSLGEFALILIPSFVLAACLARFPAGGVERLAALTAPFAAAGMACPDTGYAALSTVAGRRKLSTALGAYAGFKLLVPAGPLIVATGLGVQDARLFVIGLVLLLPVWAAGEVWVRARTAPAPATPGKRAVDGSMRAVLIPFLVMAGLLGLGVAVDLSGSAVLDFLTRPKGALFVAALWALAGVPAAQRRECLDSAIRRTGSLLLLIGAASALGAILVATVPIHTLIGGTPGPQAALVVLFAAAMLFKTMQGSSMATFAAVTPIAAPLVAASGVDPLAAVFAICLGSFIGILPNDSYYWLVRRNALAETGEGAAIVTLTGGAAIQAGVGFLALWLLTVSGVLG